MMTGSLLALLLAASAPAETVRNPGAFIYAAIGEPVSLDPVQPYDAVSPGLTFNVYDTLLAFESETNDAISPRLATAVPSLKNGLLSKDGRAYAFPIRKGVVFHDGRPLRPDDVRYSLMRFMLADPAGGPASLLLDPILGLQSTRDASGKLQVRFGDVERAVRVDGDKVVVTLKEPFGPFLSIMARWSYVMSREWAKEHGEWDGTAATWEAFNNPPRERSYFFDHMNGTGPFELERWDRSGRRVYLKRAPRYWGKPARLERVVMATVPEFATRKLMLEAGDADLIEVPRPFLRQLEGLAGVRVADKLPRLMTDPALFFTLKINPEANPDIGSGKLDGEGIPPDFFADKDLRKGFAYSFDYEAILRDTFKGTARRPKGPVPPGLPGHDPKGKHYVLDARKAVEHLKKAWGGKVWERGFRFTMTYNTGGEARQTACEILKRGVESLNPKFRVDLRGVDWPSFLDKAQGQKMPLFARGWTADYPDAHNFVFPFYHSQGRYPSAQRYRNPELDALIERAARVVDPKAREQLYWKIQALGFDEAPHILAVHPAGVYAMRSWVRGFYDNAVFMGILFHPLSKG
ncbi:MAG: ABC transporter substrate-binding protein [Elusimicrobia bacterium]|nr:ABC transporter substrate-binding protein [Elusimicrobiota bacterium]